VNRFLFCPLALLLGGPASGQTDGSLDRASLAKLRQEAFENSQAAPVFEMLTTSIGPRLTASPAHKRAAEFARDRLASYGLQNARLEPWKFGRGWSLQKLTVEMVEPRYFPLLAYADAWSNSTQGEIVGAPVLVAGKTPEEIAGLGAKLKGAILLTQPAETNFVRSDRPQPSDPNYVPGSAAYATNATVRPLNAPPAPPSAAVRLTRALSAAGAAVLLKPSRGEHGTVFVLGRDEGPSAAPAVTLSAEHYNLILRMLEQNIPVKLRVNVQAKFYDEDQGNAYNVLAELPGNDPAVRDEVVMIGAHLDSWHTGTGATDNADGSTTVIEAMRILKTSGLRPRRTIRVALWGGEEQGLLGSRAWVSEHLAGEKNQAVRDKMDVYFNIDNGTGPIYGWFAQNDATAKQIFDTWLEPLKEMGARRNALEAVGSTDHLSFIAAGVPGFNPIQDYVNYDVRTHHTNMDTADRVSITDIREAALMMAAFAYNAAMAGRKMPRPAFSAAAPGK
jgi:carboxypeptidase Q